MITDPPEFTEQQMLIQARMTWWNHGRVESEMPTLEDVQKVLAEQQKAYGQEPQAHSAGGHQEQRQEAHHQRA